MVNYELENNDNIWIIDYEPSSAIADLIITKNGEIFDRIERVECLYDWMDVSDLPEAVCEKVKKKEVASAL